MCVGVLGAQCQLSVSAVGVRGTQKGGLRIRVWEREEERCESVREAESMWE